jgi:ProP effector
MFDAHALYQKYETLSKYLPLAVGIHKQLQISEPDLDPVDIRRFLHRHTRKLVYHQSVAIRGKFRRNLDGSPNEPVSDAHREYAIQQIQLLRAKMKRQQARPKPPSFRGLHGGGTLKLKKRAAA